MLGACAEGRAAVAPVYFVSDNVRNWWLNTAAEVNAMNMDEIQTAA